jgi:hypothetical protein
MSCRVAAGTLGYLLPIDAGISHESMRGRTLKLGAELRDAAADKSTTTASAIILSLDATFIRSCDEDQRHLEVRFGNVEASSGARQVFAEVGQAQETGSTAFTDGCSGLRSILVDAGVTVPPGFDCFHIAMRLQHAEKTAGSLPADTSERENAKAMIVAEVDRLRWRI